MAGGGGPFGGVQPIDFGGPKPAARRARPGRSDRPDAAGRSLVVLYDRDCGLCTASARQLRRWDRAGRLELLPLQDVTAGDGGGSGAVAARPRLAAAVAGRPLLAALHVVDERTGVVRSGGDAALAIGAALPGGVVVRVLGRVPPVRWAVGLGYRLIARERRRIGRWLGLEGPTCDVPR